MHQGTPTTSSGPLPPLPHPITASMVTTPIITVLEAVEVVVVVVVVVATRITERHHLPLPITLPVKLRPATAMEVVVVVVNSRVHLREEAIPHQV